MSRPALPRRNPAPYVTASEWNVFYGTDLSAPKDGPGILYVSRPIWSDDHKRRRVLDVERHPEHDGRYFDSAADKDTYCVAHGLLKLRDADTSAV